MPGRQPPPISLTAVERELLQQLVRRHKTPRQIALRARIVLGIDKNGWNNSQAARHLRLKRDTVILWRGRWLENAGRLGAAQRADAAPRDLEELVFEILWDRDRPGTPPKFTPEQVAQILALACETPEESERPVSHWTPRELADEAIKRGIVESISPRQVGRFLKGGRIKALSGPALASSSD